MRGLQWHGFPWGLMDLWLDYQDGQTVLEAEDSAESKFLMEDSGGIWSGAPDRAVKRTLKGLYFGAWCTQDDKDDTTHSLHRTAVGGAIRGRQAVCILHTPRQKCYVVQITTGCGKSGLVWGYSQPTLRGTSPVLGLV